MSKSYLVGTRSIVSRRLMGVGTAALLGLMALQAPAYAGTAQVTPGEVQGSVDVLALGTMENRQNESKVDFLKRVGRVLHDYTDATKLEACGIITEKPEAEDAEAGKWVVPLVTQESHIACVAVTTVPGGSKMTWETIHSHPFLEKGIYTVNQVDAIFLRGLHAKRSKRGQRMSMPRGHHSAQFSDVDFRAGPGWLVAEGELLYQNGGGNVVNHGSVHIQNTALADTLPSPGLPGVGVNSIEMVNLTALGVLRQEKKIDLDATVALATPKMKP